MAIKLIALDLDDTLLRNDKSISERTRATLSRCQQAGVKVIYATGRGSKAAERIAPSELFDGRIIQNGAIARIAEDIVHQRLIPPALARPLLVACHERNLKTAAQIGATDYANFDVTQEWPNYRYDFELVDFNLFAQDTEKIYAVVKSEEDVSYIASKLDTELYMVVSRDGLAMVMHREATKGAAVAAVAAKWGIAREEIVAFGDDTNDLSLIIYAGVGVAMSNAVSAVQEVADCTTLSNEEDGVAVWLERRVL